MKILQEIDPAGVERRKKRSLKKEYIIPKYVHACRWTKTAEYIL